MHVFLLLILLQTASLYAQDNNGDGLHNLPIQGPELPARPGRVLLYAPFGLKSIKIKIQPIVEALADRGHNVVVVMSYFDDHHHENITVIKIEGSAVEESVAFMGNLIMASSTVGASFIEHWGLLKKLLKGIAITHDLALKNPILKNEIEKGFDVVITYRTLPNEVGVYLAHKMGAHLVLYCSGQGPDPFTQWAVGMPFYPAYQLYSGYVSDKELTFFHRVFNAISLYLFSIFKRDTIAEQEILLDKYFPGEKRIPLWDLEENTTSLVLYTGHPLLDGIRPTAPNLQYIGTLHCKLPKPLPKHLESIFESSGDDGVVLVSFGSYILAKYMKEHVRQVLLKVFGQLNQTVVWKWESKTMKGLPDNVKLLKWIPQQDILGHPKTKLFITHSGQSSFQESLCHKKPVIAFPIGYDQHYYSNEAEIIGTGIFQDYHNLTEEGFLAAIKEVIENPKYAEAARNHGDAINDQINKPLDKAVWWIEYLIRHKGKNHWRSPVHDLPLYKYFLLDVIAFFVLVVLVLVLILIIICWKLFRCFFPSKKDRLNATKKIN